MSGRQLAIFCSGVASGLLLAALDVLSAHAGGVDDLRLLVVVLAIGAAGAGGLGILHATRRIT